MKPKLPGNLSLGRAALAVIMTTMGILHFTHGQVFASIVPHYLPAPYLLVYLSGIFEIALGVGLCVEATRALSAWGLMALFVAVFPANVNMALHPDLPIAGVGAAFHPSPLALWLRLPLQLALLYWAYQYTRPARRDRLDPVLR